MFSITKENLSTKLKNECVCKAMGYPELGWFASAVEEFGRHNTLREWLESEYEDRYNTALSFYARALEWFGFEWDEVENELNECKELLNDAEVFAKTLFVETQYTPSYSHTRGDSLGVGQAKREARKKKIVNLFAYKERFERKTLNEVLNECGVIIREHYRANPNGLRYCGEILGYRVEILGRVCRFNIKGIFDKFLQKSLTQEDRSGLFGRVQERVQCTSHNEMAEKMGFTDFWRFKKGAEILSECNGLEEWIGRGFYSLGMRASEFFVGLADVIFNEREEAEELVKKCRNISRRCEKFDGLIFVITQKRAKDMVEFTSDYGVGIFNEMRQIHFDRRRFRGITREEILKWLGEEIKCHYVRNDGELGVWGKILGYKIKMYKRIFEFDVEGRMVSEIEEQEREKIKGLTQTIKENQKF